MKLQGTGKIAVKKTFPLIPASLDLLCGFSPVAAKMAADLPAGGPILPIQDRTNSVPAPRLLRDCSGYNRRCTGAGPALVRV